MRLSDLLSYSVQTRDGETLGTVSDVRIVQDGPVVGGLQAAFRVDALVVGRGGLAERLGYVRGRIEGPMILRALFSRLEHRAHVVAVSDIAEWDDAQRIVHLKPEQQREHRTLDP